MSHSLVVSRTKVRWRWRRWPLPHTRQPSPGAAGERRSSLRARERVRGNRVMRATLTWCDRRHRASHDAQRGRRSLEVVDGEVDVRAEPQPRLVDPLPRRAPRQAEAGQDLVPVEQQLAGSHGVLPRGRPQRGRSSRRRVRVDDLPPVQGGGHLAHGTSHLGEAVGDNTGSVVKVLAYGDPEPDPARDMGLLRLEQLDDRYVGQLRGSSYAEVGAALLGHRHHPDAPRTGEPRAAGGDDRVSGGYGDVAHRLSRIQPYGYAVLVRQRDDLGGRLHQPAMGRDLVDQDDVDRPRADPTAKGVEVDHTG